ncbi:hypothetical protein [Alteribacillus sp. HJP-4]
MKPFLMKTLICSIFLIALSLGADPGILSAADVSTMDLPYEH